MTDSLYDGSFEDPPRSLVSQAYRNTIGILLSAVSIAGVNLRQVARPAVGHLVSHGYTVLGLGFFSAAAYSHSLFSGLIVTGVAWFFFEWKAVDDDDARQDA